MIGKILIPIKSILTGKANIQQIEEFEFIRNNPMASTLGAGALGLAAAHDYHTNGYHSIGKYIGDKIDTVKNAVSSGTDKVREGVHDATKSNIPKPATISTNENNMANNQHHDDSFFHKSSGYINDKLAQFKPVDMEHSYD